MAARDFLAALAGTPTFSTDAEIRAEQETARKRRQERGRSVLPPATFSPSLRDRVQAALLGVGGGLRAAQGAADPFAAAVSGITGAAAAPSPEQLAQARAAEQQQAELAALDATPIEQVSPEIAQRYGLEGLPLAAFERVAPILERQTKMEQALLTALERRGKEEFTQTQALGQRFESLSKDYFKQRDAIGRVRASGKDPSAAGDLALIFNYMKILDPGSVVRESEFANAANAAGVPERVRAQWNKALRGERLAKKQRNDFLTRAERLFKSAQDIHDQRRMDFETLATSQGLDPKKVVLGQGTPTTATPAAPGAPAAPSPLQTGAQGLMDLIQREKQRRGIGRP